MKTIGKRGLQITVSAVATAPLVCIWVRAFGSPTSTGAMSLAGKRRKFNNSTTFTS